MYASTCMFNMCLRSYYIMCTVHIIYVRHSLRGQIHKSRSRSAANKTYFSIYEIRESLFAPTWLKLPFRVNALANPIQPVFSLLETVITPADEFTYFRLALRVYNSRDNVKNYTFARIIILCFKFLVAPEEERRGAQMSLRVTSCVFSRKRHARMWPDTSVSQTTKDVPKLHIPATSGSLDYFQIKKKNY